jgi:hypothetical protein
MKQSGSKKTRLRPRELPHDREACNSGSAGGTNLPEHAPKRRKRNKKWIWVVTWGRAVMMTLRIRTMLTPMSFVCSIMERGQL